MKKLSALIIARLFLFIMFIIGLILVYLGQYWGALLFVIGYIGGKIMSAASED